MTTRLYVRRPVLYGGDHVELTADYGPRRGAPFMDGDRSLVEMGMRCADGEAAQGTFLITDPYADPDADPFATSFPLAHNLVTWTEDAPGSEIWLYRGRVANDEGGRGEAVVDHETEWETTVEDCNVELRGQAFVESWVRPEETDVARLIALQAYTLNGASSTASSSRDSSVVTVSTSHLTPNTNTVTMPAKKYVAGTQPKDVVRDCAELAGKNYGVVIHHTGGSHLCLFYTVPGDHTTYVSPITISDHVADWDPGHLTNPVLEPHWERGAATIFSMQQMVSGIVGVWGQSEETTFVEDTAVRDNYEYWVEGYHTNATTSAESADKTAGVLFQRKQLQVTHRVSVILNADQVDMVGAGMSLLMRTAATHDPDVESYITRRIVECRFEPRNDGRYWCHMDIERPLLLNPRGPGYIGPLPPVQPEPPVGATSDYLWDYEDTLFDAQTGLYEGCAQTGSAWHGSPYGYAHSHVTGANVGNDSATLRAPISPGDYHFRAIIARTPDSPYNTGGITIRLSYWISGVRTTLWTSPLVTSYSGTTVESDVTFPAGAEEMTFAVRYNNSRIYEVELSHGATSSGFAGSSTLGPLAPSGPTGSIGTSPYYAPLDHTHPAQTAAVTTVEGFTAPDVQGAFEELAWKQPVRAATTAAGTLASSFENGDTLDGVTLASADRILIKNQASGAENGIYTVNDSGAPTRATDFDVSSEILGAAVLVMEGTANADKLFRCTNNAPITLGTTALVFSELGGATALIVQEDDSTVDAAVSTIDFRTALNVTSSPAGEANVSVDLGTGASQAAAGDHTHAGDSAKASASSDLTATTGTAADVTGATLSLTAGTYIVIGDFDVSVKSNTDRLFEGILDVGGVDENDLAVLLGVGLDTDDRVQVVQVWRVVLGSTTTVKLQARHSGGSAGDFTVNAANTTLTAFVAGATAGAGVNVPDLLNSIKASADTPDDEFPTSTLDGQWTVVDGSSGTVSLLNGSGAGLYDLATRPGWLLMQVGTAAGDGVELRQDYTLPDGNCIVAYMSIPTDFAATPANNEIWAGLGVNDNDALFGGATGQTAYIVFDTENSATTSWRVIGLHSSGGGTFAGAASGSAALVSGLFFRVDRDSLDYHFFWSIDGFAWNYLGSKTLSTAADNVWLFARCEATMANRMVIGVPWFRQGTALAIDPWPLE